MFQPLSLFVGLRYVRARTRKFFVSFITWASLAGVCVGVAALIVILSVMNGLENELREVRHKAALTLPEDESIPAYTPANDPLTDHLPCSNVTLLDIPISYN